MVTLEQFIAELKMDVFSFEEYWKERAKFDPQNFPNAFPDDDEGSWYEQFICYLGMPEK
jgi:hypothetical protein